MPENDSPSFARPSAFPWPPVLLVGTIGGAWGLGRLAPLSWLPPEGGSAAVAAVALGIGLGLAGLALLALAIATLLRHGTTVLPDRGADRLVTSGPYAVSRNPIYLAETLILISLAMLTGNLWFALLVPVFAGLVAWLAIVPEERHLAARFGEAFHRYQARTRRWI